MKTVIFVLLMAMIIAVMAAPTTVADSPEMEAAGPGCIKVGTDPPGFYVDPPCLIQFVLDLVGESLNG